MSQRAYAEKTGKSPSDVARVQMAAKVMTDCFHMGATDLSDRWRHLAEIHAAPQWLWPALVEAMLPNKEDDPKGWAAEVCTQVRTDDPDRWRHLIRHVIGSNRLYHMAQLLTTDLHHMVLCHMA